MERARLTQQEHRRKPPSLYDQYLDERRSSSVAESSSVTPAGFRAAAGSRGTIRTVTPEDPRGDPLISPTSTQTFERDFLSGRGVLMSPMSPRAETKEHGPRHGKSNSMSRRTSTDTARREPPSSPRVSSQRRRTIALQSPTTESGSSTPRAAESRSRMGSLQQSETTALLSTPSHSNGVGRLQSSVSQPVITPRSTGLSPMTLSAGLSPRPTLPTPNARRTLHLMKTLCGRMSGNMSFRKSVQDPWTNVYCFIRDVEGSLMYESEFGQGSHTTLIPDLRGCLVDCKLDSADDLPYIQINVPRASLELHLRLATQSELESWFAALLCWQPMQPKGINKAKPQTTHLTARPSYDQRQNSEISLLREAPVIKVGQMIYWDTEVSYSEAPAAPPPKSSSRSAANRAQSVAQIRAFGLRWWRRVSCTLRENGELKFFTDAENVVLNTVQLSQLSRCSVQRLDSSVLDIEHCIAIYPQYYHSAPTSESMRPIFLSVDTSVLYEVWFVLLRAFTIPQLYGPRPTTSSSARRAGSATDAATVPGDITDLTGMFRMERGLSLTVIEAKLNRPPEKSAATKKSPDPSGSTSSRHGSSPRQDVQHGYYVELLLDGEVRGKTRVRTTSQNPFWSQEFEYLDLPAVLSSASISLKQRTGDGFGSSKAFWEHRMINEVYGGIQDPRTSTSSSGHTGMTEDVTLGKVEITLDDLDGQKRSEQWLPIVNDQGQEIGTLLLRAKAEETVILMQQEYEPLNQLLHNFANGVTPQLFNAVPSELRRLSEALVNIYQVSNRSTEWLMALVEDEIDGPGKDTPLSKSRYIPRSGSADGDALSRSAGNDRELFVRDMNKNAALEANLLFRGNTLLTKALDIHMRRVGAEYLSTALGSVVEGINQRDPDCEVDPNRITDKQDLKDNWKRLKQTTGDVWDSIVSSAQKCPADLRFIFRHIKNCAEDRYGDFLRTVSFSSVSGFLFLRFFCPAVLSPKLFGLLKDDPKPRAKRTFVLVAKSLQTLANMAHFGSKEPWMEPMNNFLTKNRDTFKKFIEDVCFVPHPPAALSESSPSYSTPKAIKDRLPATSKEGFPSLPYLLDEGREYANLVEVWFNAASKITIDIKNEPVSSPLVTFDQACKALHHKTQESLQRAETAERPTSKLSFRWEEVIDAISQGQVESPQARPSTAEDLEEDAMPGDNSGSVSTLKAQHIEPSLGDYGTSPSSPHRRAQRDWANAPDGGALAAAAVLNSSDRNPRSGFVLAPAPTSISTNDAPFHSPSQPFFTSPISNTTDTPRTASISSSTHSPHNPSAAPGNTTWSLPMRPFRSAASAQSDSNTTAAPNSTADSRPASALSAGRQSTRSGKPGSETTSPDLLASPNPPPPFTQQPTHPAMQALYPTLSAQTPSTPAGGSDETALPPFSTRAALASASSVAAATASGLDLGGSSSGGGGKSGRAETLKPSGGGNKLRRAGSTRTTSASSSSTSVPATGKGSARDGAGSREEDRTARVRDLVGFGRARKERRAG